MKLNRTESPLSRAERNKINQNWQLVESNYNNFTEQTNEMNTAVNERIDNIIADSGTSSTEVVDARGPHPVLSDRLNEINRELGDISLLGSNYRSLSETVVERGVNVKDFGAVGDGITDDTVALNNCFDLARQEDRAIFVPSGNYLISSTIDISGVTIIGGKAGNLFRENIGARFICKTNDFTALSQQQLSSDNIQFNISNIIIENANVGLELNYVINSNYKNIYVQDSDIAYKLGSPSSVGSMFNIFDNLYNRNCRVGIESNSNEFFNNNIFNNGYIQGTDYAAKFSVSGGYGGVNNVFNNVEFRSPKGRGVILERMLNTSLNRCYLEVGGYMVHLKTSSSANLNGCIYGMFQSDNTNGDRSLIYLDEHASNSTINGGRVFLNSNYNNVELVSKHNSVDHTRLLITNDVRLVGNTPEINFNNNNNLEFGEVLDTNKLDRFVSLSPTTTEVPPDTTFRMSGFTVNKNTENINGSEIKLTKGYWLLDVNIKLNMSRTDISKYLYLRKNGVNIATVLHSLETEERTLRSLGVHMTEYFSGNDILEIILYHNGSSTPIEINSGTQSYIRLKYLG